MTEELLKLVSEKLIPMILIGMAAWFYHIELPEAFSGAVAGAGLIAFQVSHRSPKS